MRHNTWFRIAALTVALAFVAAAAIAGNNGTNIQFRDGVPNVVGPPAPTTYTDQGVLVGNAGGAIQVTAAGTNTNQVLKSGAGAGDPAFAQLNFSELAGGLNALAQHGDLCAASEGVRRNSGDTLNECFTPAVLPLTTLAQLGDLCAASEATRRNSGDSANECFTPGSVTSVALALPTSVFDISGSPVTGSGTLTATFDTQTAGTVFAGPASGSAAAPTFRAVTFSIGFGTGMDVTQNQTVYIWPALTDTVEDRVKAPFAVARTITNVSCFASTAPGGAQTATVVMGTGACGSALNYTSKATCAISGAGQTCTPSGTTSVAAGECAVARLITSATAATTTVQCTADVTIV